MTIDTATWHQFGNLAQWFSAFDFGLDPLFVPEEVASYKASLAITGGLSK